MSTVIVAPVHIQPSQKWINALVDASHEAEIIIVDDSDGKVKLPKVFDVYDYERQRAELGDSLYQQFTQFHKSSSCKNFGTWLAYRNPDIDTVIVIDSDCLIPSRFVQDHIIALEKRYSLWANPLEGSGWYSRGYPYHLRAVETWAHMGMWTNELDLYGADRVAALPQLPPNTVPRHTRRVAPYFPLSGMNVSFRREAIPYMLFIPNFQTPLGERFIRHDDIWGGYIFQKAVWAHCKALSFGIPCVIHDTIVNPHEDAAEEVPMLKYEREYYQAIDTIGLGSVDACAWDIFDRLARNIYQFPTFSNLAPAFEFWRDAFSNSKGA